MDVALRQAMYQAIIRNPVDSRRSIDALNPERSEVSLPDLSIPIGVLPCLVYPVLGHLVTTVASSDKPFRELDELLVLLLQASALGETEWRYLASNDGRGRPPSVDAAPLACRENRHASTRTNRRSRSH